MRGSEGMMLAIKWAREQKIPFLGICFGFQLAVVEWARNVCGLTGELFACPAHSTIRPNQLLLLRRNIGRVQPQGRAPDHHLHARNLQNAHGRDDATGVATYGL